MTDDLECGKCARMSTETLHERDWRDGLCRWCAKPSSWTWSFEGEPHAHDVDMWRLQDDWQVCDRCQSLTVAGDDVKLLDRIVTALEIRTEFSGLNWDIQRQQQATKLSHWINHRTSYRWIKAPPIEPFYTTRSWAVDDLDDETPDEPFSPEHL